MDANSQYLVLIDIQHDFYHPRGAYGRHGRVLAPFHRTITYLDSVTGDYSSVLRVGAAYRLGQWPAMPGLCSDRRGRLWHPELRFGPMLWKQQRSAFPVLKKYFKRPTRLQLAGFCTHQCLKATLGDLLEAGWPVEILERGVSSCGLRLDRHRACLERWRRLGLVANPDGEHQKENSGAQTKN